MATFVRGTNAKTSEIPGLIFSETRGGNNCPGKMGEKKHNYVR